MPLVFTVSVNWSKVQIQRSLSFGETQLQTLSYSWVEPGFGIPEFQEGLDLNCLFSVQSHFFTINP